jgi:hypothetical protein
MTYCLYNILDVKNSHPASQPASQPTNHQQFFTGLSSKKGRRVVESRAKQQSY